MRNLMLWSRELGLRLALLGPDGDERRGASKRVIGEALEARELRRLATPLRKTRLARRLSVVELSKIIGMDRNSLLRWESARVTPRPMALIVWAQVLDCSVVLRPIAAPSGTPGSGPAEGAADDAAC
jgi:ribosome-binding protein aMBF1 (putative translation factor)